MYLLIVGLLIGFIFGGLFFYQLGKYMALALHRQYTHGDGELDMTCEEAIKYEQHRGGLKPWSIKI